MSWSGNEKSTIRCKFPLITCQNKIVLQSLKISQNVNDPSSILYIYIYLSLSLSLSVSQCLSVSLSVSQCLSVSLSVSQCLSVSLSLSLSYEKEMLLRDRKALGCLCRGSLRRVRLQQLVEIGVLTIATIV